MPFFCQEVVPGDIVKMNTNVFARMATPLYPTMGRVYGDVYYFYCPKRVLWDNYEEFVGANPNGYWLNGKVNRTMPQYTPTVTVGSVGDYLGLPLSSQGWSSASGVCALPFRMYRQVWNEYFRSDVVDNPVTFQVGDGPDTAGMYDALLKVNRHHDMFSDCLPAPQRLPQPGVTIPLGSVAPVIIGNRHQSGLGMPVTGSPAHYNQLTWSTVSSSTGDGSTPSYGSNTYLGVSGSGSETQYGTGGGTFAKVGDIVPDNLYADLANATGASINSLRLAFATQRLYERDGLAGGGRYVELVRAHYGVTVPNATAQRPEYLGGYRFEVNMQQVEQTGATVAGQTPLGQVGAVSRTRHVDSDGWEMSFPEAGYVMGVICFRTERSYQNGIEPMWMRKDRLDEYYPAFANLGNVPVPQYALFASVGNMDGVSTFGYQEYGYEYRMSRNYVSGLMRSGVSGSLDAWHYADAYSAPPTLNAQWMAENGGLNDKHFSRTLAVQSAAAADQFYVDIYCNGLWTRPMPLYSIPGRIDHD